MVLYAYAHTFRNEFDEQKCFLISDVRCLGKRRGNVHKFVHRPQISLPQHSGSAQIKMSSPQTNWQGYTIWGSQVDLVVQTQRNSVNTVPKYTDADRRAMWFTPLQWMKKRTTQIASPKSVQSVYSRKWPRIEKSDFFRKDISSIIVHLVLLIRFLNRASVQPPSNLLVHEHSQKMFHPQKGVTHNTCDEACSRPTFDFLWLLSQRFTVTATFTLVFDVWS